MSLIRPFQALRPSHERAHLVAAVPYDVVSRSEAADLTRSNPWSFLHISRPEVDLPLDVAPDSSSVYLQGKQNFQRLAQDCPLVTEKEDSLYVYRLKMGSHEQTGIAGCFSLDEYDAGSIKKHERTRPEKEEDRVQHILALAAQTGPAFLAYRNVQTIQNIIAGTQTDPQGSPPLYDFTDSDQVTHTLWRIADPASLAHLFSIQVPALYVADGHHRMAAASRVRKILAGQNLKHTGAENYNFVLAVAFPDHQLRILPYHRIVKDLAGMTPAEFLERLRTPFKVTPRQNPDSRHGEIGMYLQGQWMTLIARQHGSPTTLDVDLLQNLVLNPILGIKDPRTDPRIDFIGGIRGLPALEKAVDSGAAKIAFSMHPTELNEVLRVADAGGIMPPKSTWFEPKLRDGLLSHCF